MPDNHARLLDSLRREYERKYPNSRTAHERAKQVLVDGISHGARLFDPYPFRVQSADGSSVTDIDGNVIVDYWQGHYTNILGHNPAVVREVLVEELEHGWGLQTGLPEERQTEFAAALARATGNERVRLTTAGTLATMYAMMLCRAYAKRELVLKVAGGWHGANPLALKGIDRAADGFERVESAGVSASAGEETLVIPFNDVAALRTVFRTHGDRIACLIFEPCLGGGGFIPATREFMSEARALTQHYGALLILDEVITGFRYCAGGMQRLYGVQADLTTFGKIVGGGMPLSVVAGRADVMDLCSLKASPRVWFNGGTFSAHPLALLAGTTLVEYLVAHESEIYPLLAAKGDRLREGIEAAFANEGILARTTGHSRDAVAGGSLLSINFPLRDDVVIGSAEEALNPALCDVTLREKVLKLGLLLHDVNVSHGLGAISVTHSDADLDHTIEACAAVAHRLAAARRA